MVRDVHPSELSQALIAMLLRLESKEHPFWIVVRTDPTGYDVWKLEDRFGSLGTVNDDVVKRLIDLRVVVTAMIGGRLNLVVSEEGRTLVELAKPKAENPKPTAQNQNADARPVEFAHELRR